MNISDYRKLRSEFQKVLNKLKPNLMITHNFWGMQKAITQSQKLEKFYCAIQRKTFGPNWAKQFDRPWPIAYGFREHPDRNPHYHVLVKACPELTLALREMGPALWRKIDRGGQLYIDPEDLKPTNKYPRKYCTKDLLRERAFEDIFVYGDTRGKRPKDR